MVSKTVCWCVHTKCECFPETLCFSIAHCVNIYIDAFLSFIVFILRFHGTFGIDISNLCSLENSLWNADVKTQQDFSDVTFVGNQIKLHYKRCWLCVKCTLNYNKPYLRQSCVYKSLAGQVWSLTVVVLILNMRWLYTASIGHFYAFQMNGHFPKKALIQDGTVKSLKQRLRNGSPLTNSCFYNDYVQFLFVGMHSHTVKGLTSSSSWKSRADWWPWTTRWSTLSCTQPPSSSKKSKTHRMRGYIHCSDRHYSFRFADTWWLFAATMMLPI